MGINTINEMMVQIIYVMALLYFAPLFHEIGHSLYLNKLGIKTKLKTKYGFPKEIRWVQEREMKPKEEVDIALAGVFAGFIPFLLLFEAIHLILWIAVFITYVAMCYNDLKIVMNKGVIK